LIICQDDLRQESLELTASGHAAYVKLRKKAEQYQTDLSAEFSAEFSAEEFALLQNMLKRLIAPSGQSLPPVEVI